MHGMIKLISKSHCLDEIIFACVCVYMSMDSGI